MQIDVSFSDRRTIIIVPIEPVIDGYWPISDTPACHVNIVKLVLDYGLFDLFIVYNSQLSKQCGAFFFGAVHFNNCR